MGTPIRFFKERDTVSNFYLIAKCPTCRQIVAHLADDTTVSRAEKDETVAGWRGQGYDVDRVTATWLRAWLSSRGCQCPKETE